MPKKEKTGKSSDTKKAEPFREDSNKNAVFASIKLTRDEYEKLDKIRKEAAKKGLRLTFKEILNEAFIKGLDLAEKEIEEIKKERKQTKNRKNG